jgi:hypothetical protein
MVDKNTVPLINEFCKFLSILKEEVSKPRAQKQVLINPFPSPPDLRWDEVNIFFVSDTSIKIRARDISKTFTFAEIGFKDRRKGDMPDSRWAILKRFAERQGRVEYADKLDCKTFDRMKAAVKDLRKRLCSIMGITDDPFYPYRKVKGYETKFSITDLSYHGSDSSPSPPDLL